jgi:hypothetical protein
MSGAIIGQLVEQMRQVNGDAMQDMEAHIIEFAGLHLEPSMANAFIETVRADLRLLDMRPGLAAIVDQLNGQQP